MNHAQGKERVIVQYVDRSRLLSHLIESETDSQDFLVLLADSMGTSSAAQMKPYLAECTRVLKPGGLLFVQGTPRTLPELGVYLDDLLTFKYWIAVTSELRRPTNGLPSVHAGIMLFTKGNERFRLRPIRFPHEYCSFCGKPLRDWGGKAHLMNPEGCAASDVWKGFAPADNYTGLSTALLSSLIKMAEAPDHNGRCLPGDDANMLPGYVRGIVGPSEHIYGGETAIGESRQQYCLPGLEGLGLPERPQSPFSPPSGKDSLWNTVQHGDAVETLRRYPDDSVDLVFADPPYNLDKTYTAYDDKRRRDDYVAWCNSWLSEYARILKPTGSLYVLNLPRWTMYHAQFLNQKLCFQNWIVWDALSEPRGKLMPAHYGLLFYTKQQTAFTFNYAAVKEHDARLYCLRQSCVRQRKRQGDDKKEALTDVWTNVHRLKHRRDRDYHPCQLPDALLERIIRLSSNPGDVVLDALAGTGTTAVVAARLGRRYVAIDIDRAYVQIIRDKLLQVEANGHVQRPTIARPRPKYAKKALQLEMRDLAIELGRLPTPEDVQAHSRYGLSAYRETFPTWGKALKAAKLLNHRSEAMYDSNS